MECSNYHPEGVIVLRVYIHCEGCRNEVLDCLRGFEGVEGVEIDANNQKVIVKGEKADPVKVAERLRKRCGKHVELVHPIPKPVEAEKKKVEVFEVVLKMKIHCESCAKEVKHCIHGMEGVETVNVDMKKNMVTVKGNMDPQRLVEFIGKKGGRYAEIVKQENGCGMREGGSGCCYSYAYDLHAPQFFSDENPNSCSSM